MGVASTRCGLRSEATIEDQRREDFPMFIHHSATQFRNTQDFYTQARKGILSTNSATEIIYDSVPPDWGPLIIDSLEQHEEIENSNASINYNSVTESLLIKVMPTDIHECHLNWMVIERCEWAYQNLAPRNDLKLLKFFTNMKQERFSAPYTNSRKTPDLCIRPDDQYQPSLVIEVGWSESHSCLLDDMRLWMIGGRLFVKVVMIIKFSKKAGTNQVEGTAELYARDANVDPFRQQEAINHFPSECPGGLVLPQCGGSIWPSTPADCGSKHSFSVEYRYSSG